MQDQQTNNNHQAGCHGRFITGSTGAARSLRLAGLTLGWLLLSLSASQPGAIYAAEAPLKTDAPAIDSPAVDTVTGTQIASSSDRAAGLVDITTIATIVSGQFRIARTESLTIARAVLDAANRFAMSPELLLGVIATESGFNRRAVSSAGARGLMQVLPSAHPQLLSGGRDLSDPAVNVTIGSSILRGYLDDSGGDLAAALSRYSGGGKGYARRVALHMQQFSERLHAPPDAFVKVALVESR
jgi:soluble lytic murein transglycosylase-like protein